MPRLKLQLDYTITELAALTGQSRYQCVKLLTENGVKMHKRGARKRVVMLSQIRQAFPDFWDSLIERIRMGDE